MTTIEIILIILWYLSGSVAPLISEAKQNIPLTNADLLFSFTVGGFGGPISLLISLSINTPPALKRWLNKKVIN